MSPRPVPTKHDAAAVAFLDAAAQLIDDAFGSSPNRPAREQLGRNYPAALEWLRVEDVIQLAQEVFGAGLSRKAFHNRWHGKEAFVRDAVIHAMLYRDNPSADPRLFVARLPEIAEEASASAAIASLSDSLLDALLRNPRSFLLLHIGPMLDQYPDLHREVTAAIAASATPWYQGYGNLIRDLGFTFRPGWSAERLGIALQSILDGFLLRSRVEREQLDRYRWQNASLFADTVIAFCLGAIDADHSSQSARDALDGHRG